MIVGHCQVHHGPDDHLAIAGDRSILDRMHAEYAALRGIDDGRRQQRAIDAAVADRKGSARQFLGAELAVLSALGEVSDGEFDFGETHAFGVPQDGNHQSLAAADGDANIVVVVVNNLATLDFGIDRRECLEGIDSRLDEERHESEFDSISFGEGILMLLAQVHDPRHVDFVERRQQCGVMLSFNESLGNAFANGTHRLPLLGAFAGGFGDDSGLGRCHCLRLGFKRFWRRDRCGRGGDMSLYIFFQQATSRTSGTDLPGRQSAGRQSRRRRRHDSRSIRVWRSGCGCGTWSGRCARGGCGSGSRSHAFVDQGDHFTDFRGIARTLQQFGNRTRRRRWNLLSGLVAFDFHKFFVGRHHIANLLQPFHQNDGGDRVAKPRHFYFNGHGIGTSSVV